MKRLLGLVGLILGLTLLARGQEIQAPPPKADDAPGVVMSMSSMPTASPQLALMSSYAFAGSSSWTPAEAAPAKPEPRFVFGGRNDFRYQLGIGVSVVRFRSSQYYATAIGTSTSLTYFTNEWFGVEAKFITAFAPTIYNKENVKYFSYGGGPKLAWRRARWEPWIHGLAGGGHIHPQTALERQNAFVAQSGGGADYRLNPRLSIRLEADWIRSHFFGQWQDSGQALAEAVLHF